MVQLFLFIYKELQHGKKKYARNIGCSLGARAHVIRVPIIKFEA